MNTINHQNSNFFWYRAVIPFNQVRGFQGLHLDYYKLLKVNTGMNTNMGRNGFSSIERGFKVNFLQLFNKYRGYTKSNFLLGSLRNVLSNNYSNIQRNTRFDIINISSIRYMSTLSKHNISLVNDFGDIVNSLEIINIDKEELNKIEEVLNIIGRLLSITKYGITKKGHSVLLLNLRKELRNIGLTNIDINKIISTILMKAEDS